MTHTHIMTMKSLITTARRCSGRCRGSGIGLIVNAGSTLESWDWIVKLTEEYPFVYGAIGIHPDEAGTLTEA